MINDINRGICTLPLKKINQLGNDEKQEVLKNRTKLNTKTSIACGENEI